LPDSGRHRDSGHDSGRDAARAHDFGHGARALEHPAGHRPAATIAGRAWQLIATPSVHFSLGSLVAYGIFVGILLWGGFHWAIELSNTDAFCLSCHEMAEFVYPEVAQTRHFANASGTRAHCTDCHVPKEWAYKIGRKLYVTNELYYHALGTLDSREKFEAKRLELAERVWESMRHSNSRECRNCHTYEAMNLGVQEAMASRQHQLAAEKGVTCIECHMGTAHRLPTGAPSPKWLVDPR